MKVGYARTSTFYQKSSLDGQEDKLKGYGCEKIFHEHASAKDTDRAEFKSMIGYLREGDELIVCSLDRIARSVKDLSTLIDFCEKEDIVFKVIDMNLDSSSAAGKMVINVLGSVAQFERELMLERQKEGIAHALAAGKKFGRPATAKKHKKEVIQLKAEGYGASEIARRVGIGRASVYRIW